MKLGALMLSFTQRGGEKVLKEIFFNLPENIGKYIMLFYKENDQEIEINKNINIVNLNYPPTFHPAKKILNIILRAKKVKEIKTKEKLDLVLSVGAGPNLVNILSSNNFTKTVLGVHTFCGNPYDKNFYERIHRILIKLLYNRADKIVAVSYGVKDDLVKNFKINNKKCEVIYNPCNIKKIQELSKESLDDEHKKIFEKKVIINVGALTKPKGQWYLIRAFKKIKNTHKDINLVIIGEGELKKYLNNLAYKLGVSENVYFLGFQKNPFKFISRANVFVLSSLWESLSNVVIESLACLCPVVSVDCKYGPREILSPNSDINYQAKNVEYAKYGILVPPFDGKFYNEKTLLCESENILADSICEMLFNESLRRNYIQKGIERAMDFDITKKINEYITLFEKTLHEKNSN